MSGPALRKDCAAPTHQLYAGIQRNFLLLEPNVRFDGFKRCSVRVQLPPNDLNLVQTTANTAPLII